MQDSLRAPGTTQGLWKVADRGPLVTGDGRSLDFPFQSNRGSLAADKSQKHAAI